MNKEYVHGFYINFDEADREGMEFLRQNLQYREAKTLFDSARFNGSAFFEDHYGGFGKNWTLNYNSADGTYNLVRRQTEE